MYLISVVIPVYNTEQYLEETIKSVINQSIGFEKNIEIILVNNGSIDASADICKKYTVLYPNNIVYLEGNENKGVSFSRNQGMNVAKGKYITFLDSDDLWSADAFLNAVDMLEKYYDEIDAVSSDMTLFEGISKDHVNNQNHKENMIIDMKVHPQLIRTNGPATIFKTEVAKKYAFDVQMTCWEDTRFLNEILLEKEKYGMISTDNRYFYRIRAIGDSTSQTKYKEKDYFNSQLHKFCDVLTKITQNEYGELIEYLQYLISYAIMNRIREYCLVLDEEERYQFEKYIYEILRQVDEKCIWNIGDFEDYIRIKTYAIKKGLNIDYFSKQEKYNKQLENSISKYRYKYSLLSKIEKMRQGSVEISEFIKKTDSVIIYGMALPGITLANYLFDKGYTISCGIDRRADKINYSRLDIIMPEDNIPEADIMIIMVPEEYNSIKKKYQSIFNGEIISIEEICK